MSVIEQVAQEHNMPIDIVNAAVTLMWRGAPLEELTYNRVESALYAYYEQTSSEEAEEALYC